MKTEHHLKALELVVSYAGGEALLPLRHYLVLLHLLSHGETRSKDMEAPYKVAQGSLSSILNVWRLKGLIHSYSIGEKAPVYAPTELGMELKKKIEALK